MAQTSKSQNSQGNTKGDLAKQNADNIKALTGTVNKLVEKMAQTPAVDVNSVFGGQAPHARIGEDIMSSRGYKFMNMIGVISGAVQPDQAKVEIDLHNRLTNCYVSELGPSQGYEFGAKGMTGANRFLAPLSTRYMSDAHVPRSFRMEMKQLVNAGMDGVDQDEMNWIRHKQLSNMGYSKKDLSWLQTNLGGGLVAPPEQGELIELLRNKEALVNAGARTVPLPPQGRLKYPRQTAASSTYWVGENAPITASDIGTGEITLQGKKLAVLIKAPNELIRFASPAAEALMRDDMTKSLALGLDLAGLEGTGGDTQPRGVINFQHILKIRSRTTNDTQGDSLVGEDIYRFLAGVEERNAEFEAFIMRPKTMYRYYQLRGDAVAAGDAKGPFLFNLIREAGDGTDATLAGHKVIKSTQISQSRTPFEGSARSDLTYIVGGMWSDLLIGMFGSIEFASTTMGDQPFVNDQTWVRGILTADIQARHESAFVWMDHLNVNSPT